MLSLGNVFSFDELRAFEGVDPISGKKRYRTQSFRGSKREAQRALNALVAEVDRGTEGAQLGQVDGPDQSHNPRIGAGGA